MTGVRPGSLAQQQGLRVGDCVHRVNGFSLRDAVHHEVADLVKVKQFLQLNVQSE